MTHSMQGGATPTRGRAAAVAALSALLAWGAPAAAKVSVLTYHYGNNRAGWNDGESALTPASVVGSNFGVIATEDVDARIDAQPLLVTDVIVAGKGMHDVVYVATENDSVYGFDAETGQELLFNHLGTPPPPNKNPHNLLVGIMSTPVIDNVSHNMYLTTFTYENTTPTYRIHALALGTLAERMPSVIVAASNRLRNGGTVKFEAWPQIQRSGLLEANGNIYAAFATWGDVDDNVARGWVIGWRADSLTPLPSNELTNRRATSRGNCWLRGSGPCFLSGIWMSGYGIAADHDGNLFFATGNSNSGSYDGVSNIQDSVVKLSGDLRTVLDLFTPWNVDDMDKHDADLASGGVMLLPPQEGAYPNLAVAAGKPGQMYLLNRDDLGGHVHQAPDKVVGTFSIGACWCGPSHFDGPDGQTRVVTSGGANVEVWKLVARPTTSLVLESTSAALASGQDPGFFTSVSSNGTEPDTAIIWAVGRPQQVGGNLTLYAFDAADSSTLYSQAVGTWPTGGANANANLVPVVANGKVYVGAGRQLVILGLDAPPNARPVLPIEGAEEEPRIKGHEIYGSVVGETGSIIKLRTRSGTIVLVDECEAAAKHHNAMPLVGRALGVDGTYDRPGVMHATLTFRAKDSPALWLSDK